MDRLGHGPTNVLTAVGFGLPVAAYFWLLLHYSVNTVFVDQWSNVPTIKASLTQALLWSALWTQHNETRMLFPNLLVVILAKTNQIRHPTEALLSGFVLLASTALIILAHRRRAKEVPWLYYCPVVFLTFTFVQSASTLWGFQIAWYLVLFSWAATLYLLDRIELLAAVRRRTGSCRPGLVLAHPGVRRLADRSPAALPPKAGLVLPRDVDGRRIRHAAGVPPGLPATAGRVQRGHPQPPGRDQVLPSRWATSWDSIRPPARWSGPGPDLYDRAGAPQRRAVLLDLALLSVITYGVRRDGGQCQPGGRGAHLWRTPVPPPWSPRVASFFVFFSASESWRFTTLSIVDRADGTT